MGSRGGFTAISEPEMLFLMSVPKNDEALCEYIDELNEKGHELTAFMDLAWDALHRCLTDGTLELGRGIYPLDRCVMGGKILSDDGGEYILLKTSQETQDIAVALKFITQEWLLQRYGTLEKTDYAEFISDLDRQYTLDYFEVMRHFYNQAAATKQAVLFHSG